MRRPLAPVSLARRSDRSRTRRTGQAAQWGWAALFAGPNLVVFAAFTIIPIVGAVTLSFFTWDLMSPPEFVGLDNYIAIANDERAINSIIRTGYLILIGVVPTVLVSFLLAALVNTTFPGIRVVRTIYLLPLVISFVASAVLWRYLYDPRFGPINTILSWLGIDGPTWLQSTRWSMPAVAIVTVWLRFPLGMLLYLAALQSINPVLLEAAEIDGAGTWVRLRHIIWPNVRPITFLVTIVSLRGVLFDSFDVVKVMTNGGPIGSTDILINYIFDSAFGEQKLGYASALATALFVIVAAMAMLLSPPKALSGVRQ